MGAPWSLADDAVLIACVNHNYSTKEIASRWLAERSVPAIGHRISDLRKQGLLPPAETTGRPRAPVRDPKPKAAVAPAPSLERPTSPKQAGMRPCLGGCGKEFLSQSAGNRICPACKAKVERLGYTMFDQPSVNHYC